LAIHGSVAGRLRPTGAWGRWPAGIFSICVRIARVPRPAQSVDSPGRLSIVRWIGREVAGLPASSSCARQSCAHFLAMHQCRSTLAHLQSFIAGQRTTTADDVSGPLVRTPCENVCRRGLLSCCRGPAPARSKPDRPRHGHELVKVGQMRRDRMNRP